MKDFFKKTWKILVGIGAVVGAIIFFFMGRRSAKKSTFKEDLKKNKEEIKKVQEKTSKVEKEKKEVKEEIKKTSDKISKTKSKLKDTTQSKNILDDFEKKYRRN